MVAISGSVVLVTGGQRGLGKAFVEALLKRDAAKVYATARRPVPGEDARVEAVPLEVTGQDAVAALAGRAGDVGIVINNAGVLFPSPLLRGDMADMVAGIPAPKISPAEVAEAVLDGIENGDSEVLVDAVSRQVKAALSGPVEGLATPVRR